MPRKKLNLETKGNGRYSTAGLNSAQFIQAFNRIQKENAKSRRHKGARSLTPAQLKRKAPSDLAKLGKKQDGTAFTRDDLINLQKNKVKFEKKFDSSTAGITFTQLVAASTSIDVKRANNQVSDGSGINAGHIVKIKGNEVIFRVKASVKYGDDDHMVRLRLEEWEQNLSDAKVTTKGYQDAVKQTVKGRLSIACDCGRHQYWYRYLATIGNYCVAPPKEYSAPKIRNPNMTGAACKHVLFITNKMQSPTWINLLATHMKAQAKKIGYLDDKEATHVFSEDEIKKQSKSRKGKIKHDVIKAEFDKYQKRQKALAKKLKSDKTKLDKQRATLKKRISAAERALQKERKQKGDLIRFSFPAFRDQNIKKGWSESAARQAFSKQFGISLKVVGAVLDGK